MTNRRISRLSWFRSAPVADVIEAFCEDGSLLTAIQEELGEAAPSASPWTLDKLREMAGPTVKAWLMLYPDADHRELREAIASYGEMILQQSAASVVAPVSVPLHASVRSALKASTARLYPDAQYEQYLNELQQALVDVVGDVADEGNEHGSAACRQASEAIAALRTVRDELRVDLNRVALAFASANDVSVPSGWQTMDSAPKDGSYVLLREPTFAARAVVGKWFDFGQPIHGVSGFWEAHATEVHPTNWMPIPVEVKL